MITKVGTFETKSDELRITDPCYDKDVWCCGTVKNCEIGKWSAFLIDSNEGDWGIRIAQNIAIFGDVSVKEAQKILDEEKWKSEKFSVGVDSGQAGIFDDSQYPDDEVERGEYGDDTKFYGKCCDLTSGENSGGVLDFGVVSSSGYGDGGYECLTVSKNKKVVAVKIIFLDEIEKNLEDENDE